MGEQEYRHFVKIYNDFMNNEERYSHREKFYYLMIKSLQNSVNRSSILSIDILAGIMGVSTHSKNRAIIKETLISMEENDLLLLYEDFAMKKRIAARDIKVASSYYAQLVSVANRVGGFTKIDYWDIERFAMMEDKSKDLSFAIYFNIIKRIYDTETSLDYSYVTIEVIEKETGINKKTIMSKIALLVDNKLLYCIKRSEGAEKDKNYYSRWSKRQTMIDSLKPNEVSIGKEDLL